MARTHARSRHLLLLLAALVLCAGCAGLPAAGALRTSAISAAPEPSYPLQPRHHPRRSAALPPALSPDIMPVFPSPGAEDGALPPSDVAPTIPSSPSPPNPDALEPDSALAPFSSAPAVAAQSPAPPPARAPHGAWALPVAVGLVAMWLV